MNVLVVFFVSLFNATDGMYMYRFNVFFYSDDIFGAFKRFSYVVILCFTNKVIVFF